MLGLSEVSGCQIPLELELQAVDLREVSLGADTTLNPVVLSPAVALCLEPGKQGYVSYVWKYVAYKDSLFFTARVELMTVRSCQLSSIDEWLLDGLNNL